MTGKEISFLFCTKVTKYTSGYRHIEIVLSCAGLPLFSRPCLGPRSWPRGAIAEPWFHGCGTVNWSHSSFLQSRTLVADAVLRLARFSRSVAGNLIIVGSKQGPSLLSS